MIFYLFFQFTINEFIFDGNINYTKIYDKLNVNKNVITINCIKKQLVKLFDVNVLINESIKIFIIIYIILQNLLIKYLSNKISSKFIIIPNYNKSLKTNKLIQNKIKTNNNYFKKIIINKKNEKKMNNLK